ncbi:MAG: exopolyphosphatase [Litorivicinaceae bacterium]
MNESKDPAPERLVAAVDLGSNSFHLTVAKITPSGLQVLVRDRERVRLAQGLDAENVLSTEAMDRGLEALTRFEARLSAVATDDIRAVGTHTLREAVNSDVFLDRAQRLFRPPIEIISGPEEARLIFHAVAHTQPVDGNFLVFDVGGGSTEFAFGAGYSPKFLSSRTMGCVTFTTDFFATGVSKAQFAKAELEAKRVVEPIAGRLKALAPGPVFATSGTAKGVSALGEYLGCGPVITPKTVATCKKFLLKASNRKITDIPEVSPDRLQVLTAGVAIFSGILSELELQSVIFADSALREGVLYTMDDRLKHHDIRERTADDLMSRYGVDVDQANRVRRTAEVLFDRLAEPWQLSEEDRHLLSWSAQLHEIGLHIAYSAFHRHGAYVLENTPLPGFNREQQRILATLVGAHRKKFELTRLPETRQMKRTTLIRLIRLLRIATLVHLGREPVALPQFLARVDGDCLELHFAKSVLESHPVLAVDLADECKRQSDAGYPLKLV